MTSLLSTVTWHDAHRADLGQAPMCHFLVTATCSDVNLVTLGCLSDVADYPHRKCSSACTRKRVKRGV
jgi:hypothetical protein